MRSRIIAVFVSAFLLHGMAVAQNYPIRVTFNTNLRAAASLQSHIVETAPAGTTLSVVGRDNRWLQINKNGTVWMANWVRHSRVEDSAPTQTQTAANIDNCCFVDRQCYSDQEWVDGYWAYQNGQCAAPAQTQAQVSTQTVSVDSSAVNNCCFIGWQCASDDDWVEGFLAHQTNQCKHPGIAIEGSPGFLRQMEQALDLLQNLSPKWYQYVISGLDRIRQTPGGKISVHVQSRHLDLSYADDLPPGRDLYEHALYTGTVFIHEACHVFRYEAGLESGGLEGERACVETEVAALLEYAPDSPEVHNNRRVLANIHRPECQWWWGEYKTCHD